MLSAIETIIPIIVAIEGERERFFTDALEAWTNFIETLDTRVRRRIKEYLKKEEQT